MLLKITPESHNAIQCSTLMLTRCDPHIDRPRAKKRATTGTGYVRCPNGAHPQLMAAPGDYRGPHLQVDTRIIPSPTHNSLTLSRT
eukprot:scaffold274374_cov40-Tisochrysis_lutea.AAC.2